MTYRVISAEQDAGKAYLAGGKPLEWALEEPAAVISSNELPRIVHWYPVAFQKCAGTFRLVVPFSVTGDKNPLINSVTGKWVGKFIPLALRSFPFSIVRQQTTGSLMSASLAISETVEKQFRNAKRNVVFDLDGKATAFHDKLLTALERRDLVLKQDGVRIAALAELDLLVPWSLNLGLPKTKKIREDLYQIDEARLDALDPVDVGRVLSSGGGRLVYGQIHSQARAKMPALFRQRLEGLENSSRIENKGPKMIDQIDVDDILQRHKSSDPEQDLAPAKNNDVVDIASDEGDFDLSAFVSSKQND
jgi:hypothetical protein